MTKADASMPQTIGFTMPSVDMPAIDNVLLAEFKGPYGGVPAFDKMDLAALKPALECQYHIADGEIRRRARPRFPLLGHLEL